MSELIIFFVDKKRKLKTKILPYRYFQYFTSKIKFKNPKPFKINKKP